MSDDEYRDKAKQMEAAMDRADDFQSRCDADLERNETMTPTTEGYYWATNKKGKYRAVVCVEWEPIDEQFYVVDDPDFPRHLDNFTDWSERIEDPGAKP